MPRNILRKSDIRFFRSGRIDITARVSYVLDLHHGDVIDLYFDEESKELYIYVYLTEEQACNFNMRYSNTVKENKKGSHYYRVQSIELTNFMLRLTNSREAWMLCGKPKMVTIKGLQRMAIPIIWKNNLYRER